MSVWHLFSSGLCVSDFGLPTTDFGLFRSSLVAVTCHCLRVRLLVRAKVRGRAAQESVR